MRRLSLPIHHLRSPRVVIVANQEEFISCQKLIYDTYVTEKGWKPWTNAENRSGFQVLLVDCNLLVLLKWKAEKKSSPVFD